MRLGEMSTLWLCLLPLGLAYGVSDLLTSSWLEDFGIVGKSVLISLAVIALLWLLPRFLAWWVQVRAVQGQSWLSGVFDLQRAAGIDRLQVMEVPSGDRWAGAAIVGWIPGARQLWLGDALQNLLTPQELEMVILHELSHVKRHHAWWRAAPLAWSLAVAGLAFAACQAWPGLLPDWLAASLSMMVSAAVLIVAMGAVSRDCEIDADLTACLLAEEILPWARGQSQHVVLTLGNALIKLTRHSGTGIGRSWLHPSLRERLRSLARHQAERRSGEAGTDVRFEPMSTAEPMSLL